MQNSQSDYRAILGESTLEKVENYAARIYNNSGHWVRSICGAIPWANGLFVSSSNCSLAQQAW